MVRIWRSAEENKSGNILYRALSRGCRRAVGQFISDAKHDLAIHCTCNIWRQMYYHVITKPNSSPEPSRKRVDERPRQPYCLPSGLFNDTYRVLFRTLNGVARCVVFLCLFGYLVRPARTWQRLVCWNSVILYKMNYCLAKSLVRGVVDVQVVDSNPLQNDWSFNFVLTSSVVFRQTSCAKVAVR